MKIRNGFVSNSSSSSFYMAYDKTQVTNDPAVIVQFLNEHPNEQVLFRGIDLGEGEDLFFLNDEQKSLIRKFPEEFIALNSKPYTREVWIGDEVTDDSQSHWKKVTGPRITAYFFAEMTGLPDGSWNMTTEQWQEFYKNERTKNAEEFCHKSLVENAGIKEENYATEVVEVCWRSCDEETWEFADRYLTWEWEENYSDFCLERFDRKNKRPFVIFYENLVTDKNEILRAFDEKSADQLAICRTNKVFNTIQKSTYLAVYKLGPKEKQLLKDSAEEFLKNPADYYMLVNPVILNKANETIKFPEGDLKYLLAYGKLYVCQPGKNIPDFTTDIIKANVMPEYDYEEDEEDEY